MSDWTDLMTRTVYLSQPIARQDGIGRSDPIPGTEMTVHAAIQRTSTGESYSDGANYGEVRAIAYIDYSVATAAITTGWVLREGSVTWDIVGIDDQCTTNEVIALNLRRLIT